MYELILVDAFTPSDKILKLKRCIDAAMENDLTGHTLVHAFLKTAKREGIKVMVDA